MSSINSFISKMPNGFGDENGRYPACSIGLFEEVALETPSPLRCIALWDGFFFLSFFRLFCHFEVVRETGSRWLSKCIVGLF